MGCLRPMDHLGQQGWDCSSSSMGQKEVILNNGHDRFLLSSDRSFLAMHPIPHCSSYTIAKDASDKMLRNRRHAGDIDNGRRDLPLLLKSYADRNTSDPVSQEHRSRIGQSLFCFFIVSMEVSNSPRTPKCRQVDVH